MTDNESSIWRFLWSARPADEEAAYRAHYLSDDLFQITAIVAFVLLFMTGLSLLDLLSAEGGIPSGLYIRTAFTLFGAGILTIVRYAGTPRAMDLSALVYTIFLSAGILYFHSHGGASVERAIGVVTLYIFLAHLAFPTYTLFISPSTGAVVAGEVYLLSSETSPLFTTEAPVMIAVLVSSALFSALASALLQRSRYHAFRAIKQVKTLSGLIPICASCKKIRDDDGFYMQVEQYIRHHSDAEFSHGLCPECARIALREVEA